MCCALKVPGGPSPPAKRSRALGSSECGVAMAKSPSNAAAIKHGLYGALVSIARSPPPTLSQQSADWMVLELLLQQE